MGFKKIAIYFSLVIVCLNLTSCSFIEPVPKKSLDKITKEHVEHIPKEALDRIIKEHVEPISVKPSFGGKPFCDYKIIDSEKNDNTIKIYLWLMAQEYYVENDKLVEGTGGGFSAVLTIKQEDNNYKYVDCNISRAVETEESLKIFPKSIRKKANEKSTFEKSSLDKIQKDAETYFKTTKN